MNKSIILMDFSWHVYRSYHTFAFMTKSTNGITRPVGHIFGVNRTVAMLRQFFPNSPTILCKDGYPKFRKSLDSEYKAQRERSSINLFNDLDTIMSIVSKFPEVYLASHPDYEADDIIATLTASSDPSTRVYIYSGDNDLLQCVDDRVTILRSFDKNNPTNGITIKDFGPNGPLASKFGSCLPSEIVLYRSIIGDTSDNISPTVPRFPRSLAQALVRNISSVETFIPYLLSLKDHSSVHTKRELEHVQSLLDNQDKLRKNYHLMSLVKNVPLNLHQYPYDRNLERILLV